MSYLYLDPLICLSSLMVIWVFFSFLGLVLLLMLINILWFLSTLKWMSYEIKFNVVKTILTLTYPLDILQKKGNYVQREISVVNSHIGKKYEMMLCCDLFCVQYQYILINYVNDWKEERLVNIWYWEIARTFEEWTGAQNHLEKP